MSDIFMDGLSMDIQITSLCGLVFTLRTREPNSFMYIAFVDSHRILRFTFMITLAAFKCFPTHILGVEIKVILAVLERVAFCTFKAFLLVKFYFVHLQHV